MKKISFVLIFCGIIFSLSSCTQAQVNTDRLLGGRDDLPLEATTSPTEKSADSDEKPALNFGNTDDILPEPANAGEKTEIDGNVFEEDFFGCGQVNYVINDVRLADSLTSAGTDEDTYQLSGNRTYDYYIMISLTIENVDVSMEDAKAAAPLINVFNLYSPSENGEAYSITYKLVYFDKGGMANTDAKRYFEYALPNTGEALDVTIGFGLSNAELSALEENGTPLYLIYKLGTMEMMEINL